MWIENKKMNFLAPGPQILCEEAEKRTLWKYFTHKYFLIGISIPLLLHLFNGLHTYLPEVPQIPNILLLRPYIPKEGFFSGFLKLKYYIYPAFIGFAFLTSSQVSFSLWFSTSSYICPAFCKYWVAAAHSHGDHLRTGALSSGRN
jgi:hypothetical protein